MPASLFDSHCHFDFSNFDQHREELWKLCQQNNITQLFIPGIHPEQWQKAQHISQHLPNCYFGIGLHPWWINKDNIKNLAEKLNAAINTLKPIALGECGLDKTIACDVKQQVDVLNIHIHLANQHQLPLILHSVKTHDTLLQALTLNPANHGGIIHGFSGSKEQAEQFTNLGFHLGIGGTITYKRAKKTINAIESIPLEYLVLETDAPDMPPSGFQGEYNTPLHLTLIAKRLAEIKACDIETIAQKTTANCHKIFKLKP